jgi:hypothetical protein
MSDTEEQTKAGQKLGFLIDVKKRTAGPVHFGGATPQENLQTYYRLLDCETIDIQEGYLEGRTFDFIVDDEGLLKADPKPSAFMKTDNGPKYCFVGNLLVCRSNPEEGTEESLSDDDIKLIYKHLANIGNSAKPDEPTYRALVDLEF